MPEVAEKSEEIPDRWRQRLNPYVRFLESELWAGGAGVGVYAIFRGAAWVIEWIDTALPIQDTRATDFLAHVLSWGAAIGAGATFVLITLYQLAVLFRRLMEEVNSV